MTKEERKEYLINIMQEDEELGLYNITQDEWFLIREEPYNWVENLTAKNIMDRKELNELASNKIYSKYMCLVRESLDPNLFWSIDEDRAKELMVAHNREVEIYSYILGLIEKDNK